MRITCAPGPTSQSTSRVSGPTRASAATRVRPAQQRPGLQGGVLADLDGDVHPGRGRIDDGDAREHPALHHAPVELAAHRGQLHAVVDPLGLPHVVGDQRRDPAAGGAGQRQHVGQVQLALVVVRAQLGQGVDEHLAVEGVDAGVDLVDRQLVGGGVAVLDDAGHRAVRGAHDAPVPGRVGDPGGQDGRGVAVTLVLGHQLGQGRAREQRDVAVGDHDGAAGDVAGTPAARTARRARCPAARPARRCARAGRPRPGARPRRHGRAR